MQTFLPYSNFIRSTRCLDNKRLGKQRVEAYQILKCLIEGPYLTNGKHRPWYNHPAVQMWKGYEYSLFRYGLAVCWEWKLRDFKDIICRKLVILDKLRIYPVKYEYPKWLGNPKFHVSHRSNLLRKDPKWYGQFGWKEPNDLPYYWPTKEK